MKKLVLAIMCLFMALSASARYKSSNSYYYRQGYALEVEVKDNFLYDYIPYYGSLGLVYKEGTGFDSGLYLGAGYSWLGFEGAGYVQLRYHFFNANFSPFVSVGAGLNYYFEEGQLMPDVRAAVGVSYRRLSLSFNYESVWANFYVEGEGFENVSATAHAYIPSISLTFSF